MSLDAITFTFFGVTSKGAKGDDLVNNVVGKNCKTWVKFNINDDKYLITRYQKYTKLNNTVILNKNGVDIKKGHREVLPEITKLICSQKAFMNTLMFGQKVKDFFTDLVDSDKKLIFREILALELYQAYYKEADKRLKAVKNELEEIEKQQGINHGLNEDAKQQVAILLNQKKSYEQQRKDAVADLRKSVETNKRLLKEWENELDIINKSDMDIEPTLRELATIEKQLSEVESTLSSELQNIEQMRKNKLLEMQNKASDGLNKIKSNYQLEYDAVAKEIADLKESQNKLVQATQTQRHKLELEIKEHDANISNWLERAEEIQINVLNAGIAECPTCEQEVSAETVKMLEKKVSDYRNNIDKSTKITEGIQEKIKELHAAMGKATRDFDDLFKNCKTKHEGLASKETLEIQALDERLITATEKINQLSDQEKGKKEIAITETKSKLEETQLTLFGAKANQEAAIAKKREIESTIEKLHRDMSLLELNIKEKLEDEYDMTQLNSYEKRLLDLDKELQELETKWDILDGKAQRLEFWKTGFSSSGIPSMLIDEAVPFMNEKVAYYLEKFTNGRYIVSFDTLAATKAGEFRDKISVNVVDTHTRANSRIQLSGGQTRIIDIATILTLGDLQENIQDVSINILLFDEIFDSLDEENIGYVSKVLTKLKYGKSIYLISHRHEDQIEADETLTLR
jgi:DNA repair exonuclease SbcCD ATPase subunit